MDRLATVMMIVDTYRCSSVCFVFTFFIGLLRLLPITPVKMTDIHFRKVLLKLSRQMCEDEVKDIKFLMDGLPKKPEVRELEAAKTGRDVFALLIRQGDISPWNCEVLVDMLEAIGRLDLAKNLKDEMQGTIVVFHNLSELSRR